MLLYYLAKYAVRLHERAHTAECGQSCVAVSFAAQFPINLTSFFPHNAQPESQSKSKGTEFNTKSYKKNYMYNVFMSKWSI